MKILGLYSTKYGTAKKSLEYMKALYGENFDIMNVTDVKDLMQYDYYILSCSIYAGHVLKGLKKFLEKNKSGLLERRFSLMICSGKKEDFPQQLADNFDASLLEHFEEKHHVGHQYNLEKMNFMLRFIMNQLVHIKESQDFIDYETLENFAKKLKNL